MVGVLLLLVLIILYIGLSYDLYPRSRWTTVDMVIGDLFIYKFLNTRSVLKYPPPVDVTEFDPPATYPIMTK